MKPILDLTIRVLQNGNVDVTGTINQKLACYGALEADKEANQKHCDRLDAERAGIVLATALDMPRAAN